MFFHVTMKRHVALHPAFFGDKFQITLEQKLKSEVEGQWSDVYGYIILVTAVEEYGMGKVQEETGSAMFLVKFTAQVFKPMRGEVLDAVVSQTHAHGFNAMIGALKVFVPADQLPGDFEHRTEDMSWHSADESVRLVEGTAVRLMIVQIDSREGFCMGTIKQDFLGVIQNGVEAI